ncbi:hypothetical protein Tco_0121812 [Tanacetum coccineum]
MTVPIPAHKCLIEQTLNLATKIRLETIAEGAEGALHLGSERVRVFTDLTAEEKERIKLNRVEKRTNFDLLESYLKHTEGTIQMENRMLMKGSYQLLMTPYGTSSKCIKSKYPTLYPESPQSSNQPSITDNFQLDTGKARQLINLTSSNAGTMLQFQDDKLWFKMSVEDTMRIITGRPFQRNNARGNVVAGNAGGQNRVRKCGILDSTTLRDKMPTLCQAQENGAVRMKNSCYSCRRTGHQLLKKMWLIRTRRFDTQCGFISLKLNQYSNLNDEGRATYDFEYSVLRIEDLKGSLESNLKAATRSSVKTKVHAPGMYAIDVKPIPHPLKDIGSALFNLYQTILKESVETVRRDCRGS